MNYNPKNTFIALIHSGKSWYLPFVSHQIKYVEDKFPLVALGENLEQYITDTFNTVSIKSLENKQVGDFKRSYLHMCSNNKKYELFCFLRWFYLKEYIEKTSFQNVLYLDSDVLLYSSLEDIMNIYGEKLENGALMVPYQSYDSFKWAANGASIFWSREILSQFCDFILRTYKDNYYLNQYKKKWDWHHNNRVAGGICDMTTLYLFWREHKDKLFNLAFPYKGMVFDNNINSNSIYRKGECKKNKGIKEVKFKDKIPYIIRNDDSSFVRCHGLHFQGEAKSIMPDFYIGPHFPGYFKRKWIIANFINLKKKIKRKFPSLRKIKRFLAK